MDRVQQKDRSHKKYVSEFSFLVGFSFWLENSPLLIVFSQDPASVFTWKEKSALRCLLFSDEDISPIRLGPHPYDLISQ